MKKYKYRLEKYHPGSKKPCPKCGREACFTRYVDANGDYVFPEHVGRCDHEHSCGYHFTPSDYYYHLHQCFFGEHLLPLYPDRKVFVVESEKTAVIASHFMPDVLWIATGGKNGCFNERAITALAGRDVVLMPDFGTTQEWQARLPMLDKVCRSVSVNDMLETMATEEQRSQGQDIADFLLMEDTPQMTLQKMIDRNPALQTLIDELGLVLVDEP